MRALVLVCGTSAAGAYADAGMKLAVVALPAGSHSVEAVEEEPEEVRAASAMWSSAASGATLALSGAMASFTRSLG